MRNYSWNNLPKVFVPCWGYKLTHSKNVVFKDFIYSFYYIHCIRCNYPSNV